MSNQILSSGVLQITDSPSKVRSPAWAGGSIQAFVT